MERAARNSTGAWRPRTARCRAAWQDSCGWTRTAPRTRSPQGGGGAGVPAFRKPFPQAGFTTGCMSRGAPAVSPQRSIGGGMKLNRSSSRPRCVAGVALVSGGWAPAAGVGAAAERVPARTALRRGACGTCRRATWIRRSTSRAVHQGDQGDAARDWATRTPPHDRRRVRACCTCRPTGEYGGVGIQIAPRDNYITAVGVLPAPRRARGRAGGRRMVEIDGATPRGGRTTRR
jgi:hypothetical protein